MLLDKIDNLLDDYYYAIRPVRSRRVQNEQIRCLYHWRFLCRYDPEGRILFPNLTKEKMFEDYNIVMGGST